MPFSTDYSPKLNRQVFIVINTMINLVPLTLIVSVHINLSLICFSYTEPSSTLSSDASNFKLLGNVCSLLNKSGYRPFHCTETAVLFLRKTTYSAPLNEAIICSGPSQSQFCFWRRKSRSSSFPHWSFLSSYVSRFTTEFQWRIHGGSLPGRGPSWLDTNIFSLVPSSHIEQICLLGPH